MQVQEVKDHIYISTYICRKCKYEVYSSPLEKFSILEKKIEIPIPRHYTYFIEDAFSDILFSLAWLV